MTNERERRNPNLKIQARIVHDPRATFPDSATTSGTNNDKRLRKLAFVHATIFAKLFFAFDRSDLSSKITPHHTYARIHVYMCTLVFLNGRDSNHSVVPLQLKRAKRCAIMCTPKNRSDEHSL
jgi:hypothetical protein